MSSVAGSIVCGMAGDNNRKVVHITNSHIMKTDIFPFLILLMTNGRKIRGNGLRHITSQLESSVGCSEKKNISATMIMV